MGVLDNESGSPSCNGEVSTLPTVVLASVESLSMERSRNKGETHLTAQKCCTIGFGKGFCTDNSSRAKEQRHRRATLRNDIEGQLGAPVWRKKKEDAARLCGRNQALGRQADRRRKQM